MWVEPVGADMRIAICGPMASGKSWIAERLVSMGFERVSLARGVKRFGASILETLIEEGLVAPEQAGIKQRRLLQTIGAEGRAIDPNLWIRDAINESERHDMVVIDDMRFVNEARALAAEGFHIVRLSFPDEESQLRRLRTAYPGDWQRHWDARDDVSEAEHSAVPPELVSLELTVEDGPGNWESVNGYVANAVWETLTRGTA